MMGRFQACEGYRGDNLFTLIRVVSLELIQIPFWGLYMSRCSPMIVLTKFLGIWPEAIVTDMRLNIHMELIPERIGTGFSNWTRVNFGFDYSIWQGIHSRARWTLEMETFFVRSQLPWRPGPNHPNHELQGFLGWRRLHLGTATDVYSIFQFWGRNATWITWIWVAVNPPIGVPFETGKLTMFTNRHLGCISKSSF